MIIQEGIYFPSACPNQVSKLLIKVSARVGATPTAGCLHLHLETGPSCLEETLKIDFEKEGIPSFSGEQIWHPPF